METQAYATKTQSSDDPSPSKPLLPGEGLDGIPQADSLSGSSSVSPMAVDSTDLDTLLGRFLDEEAVTTPFFPEAAESADGVFSFIYQAPSCSSTEFEPSQLLALVPYKSKKPVNCQKKKEDPWECPSSISLENEHSAWTPWRPTPWAPPKEAFRIENEPTGVGAGLENLGNTCFINAILQCVTHTVPFVLGLRSLNVHKKLCDGDINSFSLLRAIHDHIEHSLSSSGGVVSPYKIIENLNCISPSFESNQQEDAHEFFQGLLNKLEFCCSDLKLLYEPFNDLSLEIEDADTLPSALESFTKVEKIDDPVAKFNCENCKHKVSIEKQLMLDQAPLVATFHLKRFKTKGAYVEKIEKHVVFPLGLDLQPYTGVNETSNEELKYQLYAVVKHSGFRPNSGHYLCYIRSSPDTWHNFNDSRVICVEEEEVLSQEAYILFYAREGIPWFSTSIEVQNPGADRGISDPSPTSVLDNIVCASNVLVGNNTDGNANESGTLELDEPSVTSKGISGPLVSEPEFHAAKSVDFRDDSLINEASLPPGSSNCPDNFDKSISTVSSLGENNSNRGSIDKATSDSSFPWMPFRSQCPDKCQTDASVCALRSHFKEKRIIKQRTINRSLMHQRRTEARRCAKRMQGRLGMKFMAPLASQPAGYSISTAFGGGDQVIGCLHSKECCSTMELTPARPCKASCTMRLRC
ncbi:putative DNA-directed RNA polymerase I subunit rpa49 [Hibiscus syriacus]|uniref:Ubiquitin carboxyl-terminal hydrolase n=1 Tax=Hibiscus syriacus TaxID=106335 RepID=A0A6A3CPY6_HIBSY|nr:putative DNA-directed RNA polymerase I subunit rpa49 [Hibiscus syriacus]